MTDDLVKKMTNTETAKLMWDAYAVRAGSKTFDGKPLPTWDGLGDERQYCWTGVAEVCADRIEKLEAALKHCINALREYEMGDDRPRGPIPNDNLRPWLLGAMDNAIKALEGKDD